MEGFMMATTSGTFRITKDIDTTPSIASGSGTASRSIACQRCGGSLVDEPCMEVSGQMFWAKRCIQCGDVTDETILHNRFSSIEARKQLLSRTRSRTHQITSLVAMNAQR